MMIVSTLDWCNFVTVVLKFVFRFMQFRKPGRSAETLTVFDSWLEEPSARAKTKIHTPFAKDTSVRCLSRVEEDPSGESSEPTTRLSQPDPLNPTTNKQTNVCTHSPFLNPGVGSLLEEYYKLLESAPEDLPVVRANRYRPSIMTKIWKLLTITLPTPLQYGQSLRHIGRIVRSTAPSSTQGIIISLLLWLVIIASLMKWPLLCLVTFLFGVYYLSIGEEKHKQSLMHKMEVRLDEFEMTNNSREWSAISKEYIRIKHHRRLIGGTNLNAVDWPEHLPKPNNCMKEEIKEIQRNIQKVRDRLIGSENQKSVNSDPTTSFESAISTVQELCALVGLEQMSAETKDWDSLRNKLQELEVALGD